MGKSAKMREERRREKAEQEQLKAEKAAKYKVWYGIKNVVTAAWARKWVKAAVAAVVALVVVAAILLGVFFGVIVKQPSYLRKTAVMQTENYTIDGMMMSYYIYSTFESYYSQYGTSLNLDATTSLKKQMFREDVSWFEYCRLESQTNLRQVLLFAEKAKEQGMTLTTEETKELSEYLLTADISGYSSAFGMTADDLYRVLELTQIASNMYQKTIKEMDITDAELEKYFKENEKYFKTVDYKMITIPYGKNGWYEDASTAKAVADAIKAAKSTAQFDSYVKQLLTTIGATTKQAEEELEAGTKTGMYYTDNDAFMSWAHAEGRKKSDTFVENKDNAYVVYILTSLPAVPEVDRRNVRHILLSKETCGTDDAAKAKAEEVLAEWKKGDKTAESFGKLAEKYTEDEGTKTTGGLYENVKQGEMIDEFDSWMFDKDRKVGDVEIVKTDYGYHVMYYAGAGDEDWKVNAENAIVAQKIDELCGEYVKQWPITEDLKAINRLPL